MIDKAIKPQKFNNRIASPEKARMTEVEELQKCQEGDGNHFEMNGPRVVEERPMSKID